ncbi:phage antirepressor N-terminal domain-containing protein [Candidatus Magnetobacterium casense]|uniref:Phage antirepressor N-terminal domain-containing protein n=1 Tax=Candidatus Magnetobacterium casense TaxID=1455061 RepID=A0ABS6S5B2_9BACT|nr:phage antirepressor N-terminal domain-containing protein [Candidatus Magnetobacterium casensis]MBV6343728.1 phage antirepressor N-terminal domain-containing protein [Candidatus Magnetobacterium casensis]
MNASNNLPATINVKFHEDTLITIEQHGSIYVAMKPIVEILGLTWHGQFQRIQRDAVLSKGIRIIGIPSPGGPQETTFLELKKFHGWLFKVSVNKVKPEIRAKLIRYQEECYEVLYEHFSHQSKPKGRPTFESKKQKPREFMDIRREGDYAIVHWTNGEKAVFNDIAFMLFAETLIHGKRSIMGQIAMIALERAGKVLVKEVVICA